MVEEYSNRNATVAQWERMVEKESVDDCQNGSYIQVWSSHSRSHQSEQPILAMISYR